jgi:hypothetical protein
MVSIQDLLTDNPVACALFITHALDAARFREGLQGAEK